MKGHLKSLLFFLIIKTYKSLMCNIYQEIFFIHANVKI